MNGRYLIYNPVAYWALNMLDTLLDYTIGLFIKKNGPLPAPKKLLLTNIAHLGDAILTTSLLEPLKARFPQLEIGILTSSGSKTIFENHPLISHVHSFDHFKNNRRTLSLLQKFIYHSRTKKIALREICEQHYDLSIDLNFHYPSSAPLLWKASIPNRLGFTSAGFSATLTHPRAFSYQETHSVTDYWRELLSPLATLSNKALKPCLAPISKNILSSFPHKEYIVIHMGSGSSEKEWPLTHWKNLCEKLSTQSHLLIFTGKGMREEKNIEIVREGLMPSYNLANRLSWQEYVALIWQAKALIAVDTVAGHVASAFDTPAVLLFSSVQPLCLFSPLSSRQRILSHPLSCSPCFRGCKKRCCLHLIHVDEVYSALRSLIPDNEQLPSPPDKQPEEEQEQLLNPR